MKGPTELKLLLRTSRDSKHPSRDFTIREQMLITVEIVKNEHSNEETNKKKFFLTFEQQNLVI